MTALHAPVLADAVCRLAAGCHRVADGTVGGGGHAERLRVAGVQLLAIDRDPGALRHARQRLGDAGVSWVQGRFADPMVLATVSRFHPDFVLLDLGVSSHQLDTDARGFSFRPGVPLDMRMDPAGESAADLLNRLPEPELARVFREYGDERRARRLAATLVRRRRRKPFATSDDLVRAIRATLGPRTGPTVFARLFQALRIAVNDELNQLHTALPALREALQPGGRLAVISYHSGEDRIVKHLFRDWARACVCPPRQPVCTCRGRALGCVDPPRPIVPTKAEVTANPRARSAKLRAFRVDGGA
ncbi:MAG: 16S rRNA (cytosine(1402)-N(4))-methyltransferase RsmH [Gemmatimonadales bacterium]|nr:16S rRNA (cytosine(1402)-N(4))-methyltransferase RsmH [Gemmatimonadales bacterium]NIN50002.1 16S rRNA (cytosine(1402)-N(4))-methyltransferase RsmH [Gemmatimonadales bacterium]NIP07466.1 16S rRNA (cytosine(1402)-N(4))-methyltransferase RsmH [Gemmatimonadales bacterium]NIR03105.1 16S rRNA (cytosine(1402)-N(4))-methyltransferase RsmH [Gemmatimonadales bacterium]NIS66817.1 16S rRNA (cytosine(1402)-N(4))-methyltransferase RsmH [Gemmatimonadales bacterium]